MTNTHYFCLHSNFINYFLLLPDGAPTEIQLPARKKRLHERAVKYFISSFNSFLDDFTEEPPDNNDVDPDGDPLTVKT